MDVSVSTRSENEELPALLACFFFVWDSMSTSFLDGYLQPSEVAAPLQVLCWQVLVELGVVQYWNARRHLKQSMLSWSLQMVP